MNKIERKKLAKQLAKDDVYSTNNNPESRCFDNPALQRDYDKALSHYRSQYATCETLMDEMCEIYGDFR